MKRYLVFGGDSFYPCGGWNDLLGDADDIEDARLFIPRKLDWAHIVDTTTGEEVESVKRGPCV